MNAPLLTTKEKWLIQQEGESDETFSRRVNNEVLIMSISLHYVSDVRLLQDKTTGKHMAKILYDEFGILFPRRRSE